jgi:basic amino acid/polyamine antiporter, APA family
LSENPQLKKVLHAGQFFTLSFGLIIGIAWIVMLGEWLNMAGPLGAILGFIAGGAVMMLIALCYAEIGTMFPVDGGELAYAYEIFGLKTAYAVGWFLALVYVGIAAFEAISAGWMLSVMVPGLRGPVLYTIGMESVRLGPLLVGIAGMVCITSLNYRGIDLAAAFQDFFTYAKIAIAIIFMVAGIIFGKAAHMLPLFQQTSSGSIAWGGVFNVIVTAPFWYGGFNAIPQVMEEKAGATRLGIVGRVMMLSLAVAIAFYCAILFSASMAAPWKQLVTQELPTVAAFRAAFHSPVLAYLVLIAGLFGIITAWNAVFIAGSRVLFALGRARVIGASFGAVHPSFGSPCTSVLFVGAVGFVCVFLGRGAILPIANVGSSCFAFAYLLTSLGMLRLRLSCPIQDRPYRAPGGITTPVIASVGSFVMLSMSLYQPYTTSKGAIPLEWKLLFVWLALGAMFWIGARRIRGQVGETERRKIILGPPHAKAAQATD